jgi:hypothetical protein
MIAQTEGIHAWTPPGAGAVAVELGRTTSDVGAPVWPRYTLSRVSGLGSVGDPEDNRDRPAGQAREIARLSLRRGKTVTYEGKIKAQSLLELREAEADLRAAFDDEQREGRMDVSWHPLLVAFAAVPAKFFEARALTCDVIDVQTSERWERPYVVGLRMGDRRYFDETEDTHQVKVESTENLYEFT